MYVKQIIIQGFKSYKNQTIVDPFSPKHNVIVGRNGSGKSNFFAAMRFALGDTNTVLGREDRQALLHEGSGSAVMSAYVELVFDNSDQRFPNGKDELILRRTIGMKKDDYSVDRKNATKLDVQNLFDTAGFSRSNPYYIVPQGRITHLTNMKDSERLNLLKTVAGTKVYDEKKTESEKIMTDTNNKLASIDAAFEQINERLGELEEEQEELRNFQEKDRERRGLEYALFSREQDIITGLLAEIEDRRTDGIDLADENRETFAQAEDSLAKISQEIETLSKQMETARQDKKQLERERRDKAKARAQVELDLRKLSDGQTSAQQAKQQRDAELQRVRSTIQQREKELAQVLPNFQKEQKQEDNLKAQLDADENQRQRLYAKQGRNARFKSKQERDNYLTTQINDTYASLNTIKAVRMQTTEEIKELDQNIKGLEPEVQDLQSQINSGGTTLADLDHQAQAAKERREKLHDDRSALWRKERNLDSDMRIIQESLRKAERSLSHMMDGNTSRGIDSVRRIKAQYNLQGCYGTLAELIQVDTAKVAAEVTAGNSLFHYVVDTDETATKVLEILNKERGGRVTFMPLNRLKPHVPTFPNAQDARPLMSFIQCDPMFVKAAEQVFGKSLLCQNLTVAAQYARTHGVNAVTPEGDRSDKKGALTGGYVDKRHSRLDASREVVNLQAKHEAVKAELNDLRNELNRMDQTVTKAIGEEQKIEQERRKAQNDHGPLRQHLKTKIDQLENLKTELEKKKKQEANVATNVRNLSEQQNAFDAEKATDFKKALTTAEETQLENLSKSVQTVQKQHAEASARRSETEARKSILEDELKENLRPVLEQLEASELETATLTDSAQLKDQQRTLKRLTAESDRTNQQINEAENALETGTSKTAQLETQASEIRKNQEELAKAIEKHQRRLEKSMQKKAALQVRKQQVIDDIRDIGAVPEEMRTKFSKEKDSEKLVKRLHKVQESLKKYTSVNKHAFEHYRKSVKQREELTERRTELEKSKESIEELVEILDTRKDAAIERTFKQVSRNFAIVFEKLVPAGKGRLIIQRRSDRRADEEEEEDAGRKEGVENYTGVGISVSFNSKHDEQQRIQQLSGGQKSLCALTLIFAIQASDPAPFYIFDEIDANLDAQYRTAVAEHILSLSSAGVTGTQKGKKGTGDQAHAGGGQFICTTFRPEMLRVAEKCYGVTFANNISRIDPVSKERALEFVEGQAAGRN